MELTELIRGLDLRGAGTISENIDVSDLRYDSRQVVAGDLFVAWPGEKTDGRRFAAAAVEAGAVAVLAADEPLEPIDVPWLIDDDPRSTMGTLAARLFGHPDRELLVIGVTGTNGKTTITLTLQGVLEESGRPAGLLGTLGYRFRDLDLPGERTTPEGSDLFRYLRRMREAGAEAVVMEVSSHALAQGRVDAMRYDVAVFTNLTRDHFDFHDGFEDYYAAKRHLFDLLSAEGRAVVNVGDPWGRRLVDELGSALTFGEGGDVDVRDVRLEPHGSSMVLSTPRGDLELETPLVGRYNVENLMAVVAVAEVLGLDREAVRRAVARRAPVRGRLEPVDAGQQVPIFVDFAHTDGGLEAALRSLRELGPEKIAVVFGCGGDRDPGKRRLMGRVAGELADLPIVTNDNPRSEDPLAIITAVEEGLKESGNRKYKVIPDRREAIRRAVSITSSRDGWCLLIAGKGHEEMQILGDRTLPFSDRDEVVRALEESLGTATDR